MPHWLGGPCSNPLLVFFSDFFRILNLMHTGWHTDSTTATRSRKMAPRNKAMARAQAQARAKAPVADPPSASGSKVDEVDGQDSASGAESESEGESENDNESESESEAGHSSGSGSDSHSDSDSLDSEAPRKRRKHSPKQDEDEDGSDQDDLPKAPPVSFSAPSRIRRRAAGEPAPKPAVVQEVPREVVVGTGTTAPIDPYTTFDSLGVRPWLVQSLANMAIKRPTGIQKGCIPEILKGRDCIGGSRTGSGKTVAFAVPILQRWAEDPSAIYGLVLTPTR